MNRRVLRSPLPKSRRQPAPLGIERVEPRMVMSVNPLVGANVVPTPGGIGTAPPALAAGSIRYDAATRVLTIEGSDLHDDVVNVFVNHRTGAGSGTLPDLLTVTLANVDTPRSFALDPQAVDRVVFNGHGGDDFLDNRAWVRVHADGGAGSDVLLGGPLDDIFQGGDGDDWLDGRQGDDTLLGQGGEDALFGDSGTDALYGGDLADILCGGGGTDFLYGEAGADRLYGGAARDRLDGGTGKNAVFADYGADQPILAAGLMGFDWFDRNLRDSAVRSQARLEYRDGVLSRDDMLGLYSTVARDGVDSVIPYDGTVTADEIADLKMLTSIKINVPADSRFLARKIAFGDLANARFQGQPLGNLAAGSRGGQLDLLVAKWFKGRDLPVAADDSLSTLRYEMVAGSLFVDGPDVADIDQGSPNDCYFLAALGGVARRSPATIQQMFTDNGDGTWTVRFFVGGAAAYVTVDRQLPVLGKSFSAPWAAGWGIDAQGFQRDASDPGNELWVALAEKAYAQLNESGTIGQDGTNDYRGIDFGHPVVAFRQITGKSVGRTSLESTDSSGMIKALAAGRAIALSSKESPANGLVAANHAYTVLGYDQATRRFQLYNPWGQPAPGSSSPAALIELVWADMVANFDSWASATV